MLVKIIIVLILTIAVGVLGFSDIGEGVFNFVDKSAAAEFSEDARDLTQIVEIYNTDQEGAQTAFAGTAVAETSTVDAITVNQLSTFLIDPANGAFLKKNLPAQYELLADVGGSAYLRFGTVAGDLISEDVCQEINEISTGQEGVVVDVDFGADNATMLTNLRAANLDTEEMICANDIGTGAGGFQAFYRLGAAD